MSNQPLRNFTFTVFNYTDEDLQRIRSFLADIARYAICGYETCPTTGRAHIQGYCALKKSMRFNSLKHNIHDSAHIERAMGNEQHNFEYCSKEGNYEEWGKRKEQGKRTDLEEAIETLRNGTMTDVAEEHPTAFVKYNRGLAQWKLALDQPYTHDDVRGVWIWGPPGSGKSHAAREHAPDAYIKPQNKWWDGYSGQDIVILDDLDTPTLGHYLKIWTDKYATTGETKGGTINLQHKLFIVTSNYTPDQLWPDDPIMAQAIKRRCIMNHKQFKESRVNFSKSN